jgi:hypothetical protein
MAKAHLIVSDAFAFAKIVPPAEFLEIQSQRGMNANPVHSIEVAATRMSLPYFASTNLRLFLGWANCLCFQSRSSCGSCIEACQPVRLPGRR